MRLPLFSLLARSLAHQALGEEPGASALRVLLQSSVALQVRQSSNTPSSIETVLEQEPLGAWRHEAWHRLPDDVGAVGAYKIFKRRLEEFGPQREYHLLAMLRRISSAEHAALGLEAISLLRRYRANRQQHSAFRHYVGNSLMVIVTYDGVLHEVLQDRACDQKALSVGAYDVVLEAFRRNHELGLGRMSKSRYNAALSALSEAGQLETLLNVYATMPVNGVRPSRNTMFIVVRACKEAGRMDLARAYIQEFEANGVQARPGIAAMTTGTEAAIEEHDSPATHSSSEHVQIVAASDTNSERQADQSSAASSPSQAS